MYLLKSWSICVLIDVQYLCMVHDKVISDFSKRAHFYYITFFSECGVVRGTIFWSFNIYNILVPKCILLLLINYRYIYIIYIYTQYIYNIYIYTLYIYYIYNKLWVYTYICI